MAPRGNRRGPFRSVLTGEPEALRARIAPDYPAAGQGPCGLETARPRRNGAAYPIISRARDKTMDAAEYNGSDKMSAAEHARLNGFILDIASAARGTPIADSSGNWRFGSKGGLCVYANGQFHDFSGGAREHGFSAFQLIQHLYPNEDSTVWARAWLACHPGAGAFVPGESDPVDDFADVEASTYIQRLYDGAAALDDTAGYIYVIQTRDLPLDPEDAAQLRWIPDFRGNEGALIAPVTDDDGKLVRLLVTLRHPRGLQIPARAGPHHNPRREKARSLSSRIANYGGDRDGRNREGPGGASGRGRIRHRQWRRRQSRQGSAPPVSAQCGHCAGCGPGWFTRRSGAVAWRGAPPRAGPQGRGHCAAERYRAEGRAAAQGSR